MIPDGGFRVVLGADLALSLSAAILPLVNRLSSLPGDRLSEPSVFQVVAGIAIPLVLLGAAIVCFLLFGRAELLATVSCLVLIPLLLAGVVSFVSIPLQNPEMFKESDGAARLRGTITSEGISDLGSDGTVLYLCIDRLDEAFCRKALELDPTIFDSLDGFTRYTDHVSLYSNTYPAVCYMLTGREADLSLSRSENFRLGYCSPRLLGALSDAGYSMGIYADGYYCFGAASNVADYADNLIVNGECAVKRKPELSLEMLSLSLFRSLPSVFSPLFSSLSTETLTDHVVLIPDEQGEPAYDGGNDAVKAELDRRGFPVVEGKRFNYVHVVGMHAVLDAEETPRQTLHLMRTCFSIVNAYLDALREAGLYRDATVVITGDHPSPISDYNPVAEPRMTALFVKRRGDAGTPLKVSSAQVSQGQIASEILDSVGISLSDGDPLPLSQTPENIDAVRYHVFRVKTSNGIRMETYRITGPADDFSNWTGAGSVSYKKRLED